MTHMRLHTFQNDKILIRDPFRSPSVEFCLKFSYPKVSMSCASLGQVFMNPISFHLRSFEYHCVIAGFGLKLSPLSGYQPGPGTTVNLV